jgi:hypothetical protein
MPDRTNVDDALFPDDNIFNDDYARDINASIEDHRNVILDYFETAVIFRGLDITNGTNPNTFRVNAGRAAGINGYRIIVPLPVDNIACVDATGNPNYIAIRHVWAYSGARLPAKAGAVTYNSIRSDDYEINVALVQQAEAAGWVLLGYTYKSGGTWYYVKTVPTYRSRPSRINLWDVTLGYAGNIPIGTNDMYHHGVQGARIHPPGTILIERMSASLIQAPAGAAIDFQMTFLGGVPGWAPAVHIPIGSNYGVHELGMLSTEIDATDWIGCWVIGNAGLVAGGNAYVNISGSVVSG